MSDSSPAPDWPNGHPNEGTLHEGLDGQLAPVETAHVAEHVALCAACRARVAEAYGVIADSRRIMSAMKETPAAGVPGVPALSPGVPVSPGVIPAATSQLEIRQSGLPGPMAIPVAAPLVPVTTPIPAIAAPVPVPAPMAVAVPAPSVAPKAAVTKPTPLQPATRAPWRTRSAAQPKVSARKPRKLRKPVPWKRVGRVAAAMLLVALGAFAWDNRSEFAAMAGSAPSDINHLEGKAGPRPDSDRHAGRASATQKLANHSEYFDSLVLTRRTCTAQCDEYELRVMAGGTVRYVQHVSFGQPRVVQDELTALRQKSIGSLLSIILFESATIAPTGHMLCNASADDQRTIIRIAISKGNVSQSRSANSCKASSGALLALASQLDSLAGTSQLQRLVPDR